MYCRDTWAWDVMVCGEMAIRLLFCYGYPVHTYRPRYDAKVESRPQEADVILPSA